MSVALEHIDLVLKQLSDIRKDKMPMVSSRRFSIHVKQRREDSAFRQRFPEKSVHRSTEQTMLPLLQKNITDGLVSSRIWMICSLH